MFKGFFGYGRNNNFVVYNLLSMKARMIFLFLFLLVVSFIIYLDRGTEKKKKKTKDFVCVGGAYALSPLLELWKDKYEPSHKGIKIHVFPSSSSNGNLAVIKKMIDVGMYSGDRSTLQNRELLNVYPVAMDGLIYNL